MSTNYSPELVKDGAVFVGDARASSTATAGSRLYDQAGVDSTAVKLLVHGNEGSGQSFTDSSLSNHTITVAGNVTHSTTQSKFNGGSIYFDGTGDYLSVADSADWTFGTGDFTIDLWIYPTTIGSGGNKNYIGTNPNQYLTFASNNSGGLLFYYGNGTWTSTPAATSNVVVNNTWQHVAVSRSGGTVYLFCNGVLMTSRTQSASIDPPNIEIGAYGGGASDLFVGYMDEVRITKGAALWTQNFTPPARRDTLSIGDGMMYNGTCFDFDGTDDKVVTSDPVITGTGDFTFTAWINRATVNTTDFICGNYGAGNSGGVEFYVSGGTVLRCYIGGNYTTGSLSMVADTWYHVAVTRTSGTLQNYINAATDGAAVAAGASITGSNNFSIGNGADYTSENMDGKIADVKAFNVALSLVQIKELYDDSKVIIPSIISQTNLKGWWPLAEGAGGICYDGSGNGYHGIVSNEDGDEWLTGQTGPPQLVEGYNRPMQFDNDGALTGGPTLVATNDYTFSWWCRSTDTSDNQNIFTSGGTAVGAMHLNFSGTNNALLYLAGTNYTYWYAGAAQDDGKWHHWLITYYGTASSDRQARDSSLYIDGVLIGHGSYNDSAAPSTWSDFRIGTQTSTGTFNGGINEFIIYEGMLGSTERAQLYATDANGGPLPPDPMSFSNSSDIVAYWRNDDSTTWKNRGPQTIKNFTDVATDPINDSNSIGGWTHNGTSLTSVTGGRTGFIDGAMRVAPRYRLLFDSGTNHTANSIVAVTEGKSYKVSAWYMAGSVSSAMLRVDGPGLSSPVSIGAFTTYPTYWINKTATFTATATANVTIELHNRATGTQYFDDVTLIESGPALDLTVGGSPDVTLIKQGYNGSVSTSTGRDNQGFPLLNQNNGAVGFNGTDDHVTVGPQINSLIAPHLDCSFCCWFRVDAINADQVIFSTPTIGGNKPFIVWFDLAAVSTDNTGAGDVGGGVTSVITVMVTDSGAEYRYTTDNGALSADTWFYLCVVLDPSNDKFYTYLNGTQVALFNSSACDGIKTFTDDFNIGDTSSSSIDGQIANVQVYNRALSVAEITQNMNAQRSRFE